jgi:signal transduction histidine kinase
MTADESMWLGVLARVSRSAVVLLDSAGEPVASDPSALRVLGADSLDAARALWRGQRGVVDALRARAAQGGGEAAGSLEVAGTAGTAPVGIRIVALESGGCLALLGGADEERVAFVRKLGHDLRGPLNAMVLNLDLLRTVLERGSDDIDEADRAKRARYLASLHREIGRMNELLGAAVAEVRSGG